MKVIDPQRCRRIEDVRQSRDGKGAGFEVFHYFACYGARPHGEEPGSVDRHHNLVGSRLLEPDPQGVLAERGLMLQAPYVLDQTRQTACRRLCGDIVRTADGTCWPRT